MAKRYCPFSRWTFSEEDVDAFFFSFRLIFTQNVGRAFSARRSASYSNSRLTEGEIPTPFPSSAPSGTRGVCMQKVVCQGKVRLIFTPYILLFFFFFLCFFFLNSTLKWVENECALPEQQGLLDWFRLKVGGGLNTDKKKQQCNRYAIILQLYYPRDFAVHAPLIHIHVDLKIGFLVANSWYR